MDRLGFLLLLLLLLHKLLGFLLLELLDDLGYLSLDLHDFISFLIQVIELVKVLETDLDARLDPVVTFLVRNRFVAFFVAFFNAFVSNVSTTSHYLALQLGN